MYARVIADRLGTKECRSHANLVDGLGALRAVEYASAIAARLEATGADLRRAAVTALGRFGQHAGQYASELEKRLKDQDSNVRRAAVEALTGATPHSATYTTTLAKGLNDLSPHVLEATLNVLTHRPHLADHISRIVTLLRHDDPRVRLAATRTFSGFDKLSASVAASLVKQLSDEDDAIREAATQVLAKSGTHATQHLPALAQRLNDDYDSVRAATVTTFLTLGPLDVASIPPILVHGYNNVSRTGEVRFLTLLLTGGSDEATALLRWLANPQETPMDHSCLTPAKARQTMTTFKTLWPHTSAYPPVRLALAQEIGRLVSDTQWTRADKDVFGLVPSQIERSLPGAGYHLRNTTRLPRRRHPQAPYFVVTRRLLAMPPCFFGHS